VSSPPVLVLGTVVGASFTGVTESVRVDELERVPSLTA
jgi:hypothetical protein